MTANWADALADRIAGAGRLSPRRVLFLGATDTGKTTLLGQVARRIASRQRVAVVDADIGQSHIGPPATVGWAVAHEGVDERISLPANGIAFVGDVTPVGHLLQLTAALAICVEEAEEAAEIILIDTPGLVTGGAAQVLWWTVQRLLRPERIIAVQRDNELADLLAGLQPGLSIIERIAAPPLRRKSPEAREQHRHRQFARYFADTDVHTFNLSDLTIRATRTAGPDDAVGRIAGLTDRTGRDMAVAVIEQWQRESATARIRAPQFDAQRVGCLTVGNVRIETPREGS